MTDCRTIKNHRCIGNFRFILHMIVNRGYLKDTINFSAALLRCKFGGTSWNLTFYCLKNVLITAGHLLSRIWSSGYGLSSFRYLCITFVARNSSSDVHDFISSAKIAFLLWA